MIGTVNIESIVQKYSLHIFEKSLKRPQGLVGVYKQAKKLRFKGRNPHWYADLLRSSIVLAFSTLDTYVHGRILEEVTYLVSRGSDHIPKNLRNLLASVTADKWLIAIYRKRPKTIIRTTVESSWRYSAFQNPEGIADAVGILDLPERTFWQLMAKHLAKASDEVANEKNAEEYIAKFIKRRNDIAHAVDTYMSKYKKHKVRKISDTYAQECLDKIKQFGIAADKVLREWRGISAKIRKRKKIT